VLVGEFGLQVLDGRLCLLKAPLGLIACLGLCRQSLPGRSQLVRGGAILLV